MSVPIVFAVRLIVLLVIGNEVVKRESIMRGDEVYGGPRLSAAFVKQVRGCGKARRQVSQLALITLPERAHRIAKAVIPFGPARRKMAHLIASGAAVPWFRDQLDLTQDRILPARIQKAPAFVEAGRLSCQDRCKIEAEAVDVHFLRPISQRVRNELQYPLMTEIDSVR